MKRLVLHIGHPKTGTTALQSVLSANANKLLEDAAVLYPTRTVPTEYKHALAIPWLLQADNDSIRRRARLAGNELETLSKGYWESLVQETQQRDASTVILSAEGFWSILRKVPDDQAKRFRNNLYAIADHVTVVAYIKSPASYFLSRINQKLRNYRSVMLPRVDYISAAMQNWENLGFDAYSWRIFDRKSLINEDIIDDFCGHHLPSSLDASTLTRSGVEQANSSVSNEALVILEAITAQQPILSEDLYDPRRSKIVSILRQADAAVGGNCRPSLTRAAHDGIVAHSKDLQWLGERGLHFSDIGPSLINSTAHSLPERFTSVADFCPIDPDRLESLRSLAMEPIDRLFQPQMRRRLWSLLRK